jgi:uncharacterized protein
MADRFRWFEEIKAQAEKGEAGAQFDLGVCYHNGEGVATDAAEAVKWYRKAAEQGEVKAQFILGAHYESGQGATRDFVEAHRWFQLASAQGHSYAKRRLANIERQMTPKQIAEASRRAREFKPRKAAQAGASPLGQPSRP